MHSVKGSQEFKVHENPKKNYDDKLKIKRETKSVNKR